MFTESLHFLKELPSPEGTWDLVEVIGEWKSGRFVSLVSSPRSKQGLGWKGVIWEMGGV